MVVAEISGEGRINRPSTEGAMRRKAQKLTGKANWFKTDRKTINNSEPNPNRRKRDSEDNGMHPGKRAKIESVLFVTNSPNSTLKKKLKRAEDSIMENKTHGRVKVV